MKQSFFKISLSLILSVVFCFLVFLFSGNNSEAGLLRYASDQIFDSAPSVGTSHRIIFRTVEAIPASGKIIITPEKSKFNIIFGMNYTDLDLAVSDSRDDPGIDRTLASVAGAVNDGVAVSAGVQGKITITLNSTTGIEAGKYVHIDIGYIADFGDIGDKLITNPSITGSYSVNISSYNNVSALLDYVNVFIAIVDPVTVSVHATKLRSNGSPKGVLLAGTTQTLMSLYTNYRSYCKYSQASSTSYHSMEGTFTNSGNYYHSVIINGLTDGVYYYYFVRCKDLFEEVDITDFAIEFSVETLVGGDGGTGGGEGGGEGGGTGGGTGDGDGGGAGDGTGDGGTSGTEGPGSGGGTGGGSGGGVGADVGSGSLNLSPYPTPADSPIVVLSGWSFASRELKILQDNIELKKLTASLTGVFSTEITDLKEGPYTFSLLGTDSTGKSSALFSSTFWVKAGTKTVLSNIVIPPTISLMNKSVKVGDPITIFGEAPPGFSVESFIYMVIDGKIQEKETARLETIPGADNKWQTVFSTANYLSSEYRIKSRVFKADVGHSNFSDMLSVGVGKELSEGSCPGADLNKDGKVNITDFSILLFHWGTNNACADQNSDGTVNIVDFSIMLFNWTG